MPEDNTHTPTSNTTSSTIAPMSTEEKNVFSLLAKPVQELCTELEDAEGVKIEARSVFLLSQLAFDYSKLLALDTTAFAAHRSRAKVTAEDVMLVARRDDVLLRRLQEFDKEVIEPTRKKVVRRKSTAGAAAPTSAAAAGDDAAVAADETMAGTDAERAAGAVEVADI